MRSQPTLQQYRRHRTAGYSIICHTVWIPLEGRRCRTSFGKAHALAELSHREFQSLLGDREIPRHYTDTELAEDLDYAE
ncbi:UPF0175 family protein [Haloarcula rubripromontorii]|uniref:UPF0175 family protein n=1 Tax=Haloarcula rubripromontorii TaxID=1705562 RepID=UPI0030B830C6